VSRVVPPERVLEEAKGIAQQITKWPTKAVRGIKRLVLAADRGTLDVGLELERAHFHTMLSTEDTQEGFAAFCEKRPPRYRGIE
jgi:enoyl-CoA hydratase/carnithine racemase